MMLQCEFVAERNRVNPNEISWLQYDILNALRDGPALPSALSVRLGVIRSKLSKNLSVLRNLGYVEQKAGEHDRREMITSLTPAGEAFLHHIDMQHHELAQTAAAVWNQTQQREFVVLAEQLINQLERRRVESDQKH